MTNKEFAERAKQIAEDYKTAYMLGTWGWPAHDANISRAVTQYSRNSKYADNAKSVGGEGFMFDCCGLVKGILWGWSGNSKDVNGGAPYKANGVPDVNEDGLLKLCKNVTTDFSTIAVGEFLWLTGHCAIYIGDGLAVEATPAFENGVQITAVANLGTKSGYNKRTWVYHGKLPFVEYIKEEAQPNTKVYIAPYELKKGHKGEQVKAIQQLLIAKGYSCGADGADGDFGANTEKAVKEFQKDNIGKTKWSDGIVGKNTWCALLGIE